MYDSSVETYNTGKKMTIFISGKLQQVSRELLFPFKKNKTILTKVFCESFQAKN